MIRLIAILALLLSSISSAALAQKPAVPLTPATSDFYANLSNLNRVDPLQNPEYEQSGKIIGRKLIDNKNKVVGVVKDVILAPSGTVTALNADFDRLRLSENVYLNYQDMKIQPNNNGYQLAYRDSEIKDMYPQLLAGVEAAAGDGSDAIPLSKLVGAPVRNPDGTRIGTVSNVLFGAEGSWAEALYIRMSSGALGGRSIAVPFGLIEFKNVGDNRTEISLNKDQNEAIIKYLQKR